MQFNPIKSSKNSLLNFIRYFYDENFQYIDKLFENQGKKLVRFVLTIALTGFVGWLFIVSLISLFPINWIKLGSESRIFLNIFQIGLIVWCSEKTYKYLRGGYKK